MIRQVQRLGVEFACVRCNGRYARRFALFARAGAAAVFSI